MKTIWGFGGVRFAYLTNTATFTTADGKLSYEEVGNTYTAKDGTIKKIVKGYRARCSIKIWNNIDAEAYALLDLFNILTSAQGNAITTYPRYNVATGSTLEYQMILASNIEMIDVAQVEVGQYIELSFIGTQLLSSIAQYLTNPDIYLVIDENDNQIVDESGYTITMEL